MQCLVFHQQHDFFLEKSDMHVHNSAQFFQQQRKNSAKSSCVFVFIRNLQQNILQIQQLIIGVISF